MRHNSHWHCESASRMRHGASQQDLLEDWSGFSVVSVGANSETGKGTSVTVFFKPLNRQPEY